MHWQVLEVLSQSSRQIPWSWGVLRRQAQEEVKQRFQVFRSSAVFGMELNTEKTQEPFSVPSKFGRQIHTNPQQYDQYRMNIRNDNSSLPEEWLGWVYDALVTAIVLVGEENLPVVRQSTGVDCVAVVLAGDVAPVAAAVLTWLVVPAITVPAHTAWGWCCAANTGTHGMRVTQCCQWRNTRHEGNAV